MKGKREKQSPREREGIFRWLAGCIIDWMDRRSKGNALQQSLQASLEELHPGEENLLREHRVGKLAGALQLGLAGILICILGSAAVLSRREILANRLERPAYGEAARTEELLAGSGESEAGIDVTVSPRQYSGQEIRKLLDQAVKEVDEGLLGENETREKVCYDLCFPERAAGGNVTVGWSTVPYGRISLEGELEDDLPEEGEMISIRAELTCQGHVRIYETAVMTYPSVLTGQARFKRDLRQALKEAQEESCSEAYLILPSKVGGSHVGWRRRDTLQLTMLFLICLCIPWLYAYRKDQGIKEKAEKRRRELKMDYSSIVWQLALLIGAGMTLRGSFQRITQGYEQGLKASGKGRKVKKRAAYEEMKRAVRDMGKGVAESRSYEQFGRRCTLPEYVRLGTQLSGNLRKGSKGLAQALAAEAVSSMEEQQNLLRKAGETAGTRMIFPMILMMLVVLIVLMVPAFMSM